MKKIITLLIQSKNYVLILALSVGILTGCKKEIATDNTLANTAVPVKALDHVKFLAPKNILVFENAIILKKIIADNSLTMGKTVDEMKTRFPAFISMAGIYTQFDKKEAALIENLDDSALSSTNVDWTKYLKMSDIGKAYSDMILVKQFADNQEYYYEMNISEKHYADFVNPEGLMVVNDTIYQFSAGYVKLITDGDYSKIAMLSTTTVSSATNHILVIPSSQFMLGYYTASTGPAGGCKLAWDKSGETASGSGIDERRIGINVHFEQHPDYVVLNKTSCYTVLVYAKKKQLIISRRKISHIWVDAYPRECTLSGEFSASHSPRGILWGVALTPKLDADGSGYNAAISGAKKNPFVGIPCSIYIPFYHYTDYSMEYEPCYTMINGKYEMLVKFAAFSVKAAVAW